MEPEQDPYCYPGTTVLRNLPGLKSQVDLDVYENQIVWMKLHELKEQPINIADPLLRLKETHRRLFGEVFDWAGEYRERMGLITKRRLGQSVVYCNARFVPSELERVASELKQDNMLKGLDKLTFGKKMAYFYGELDAIHPFREGNSRTLRQFTSDIARESGFRLDWSKTVHSENAQNKLYEARDNAVLRRDTSGLEKIIFDGLSSLNEKVHTQSAGLLLSEKGSIPNVVVAEDAARNETQNRLNFRIDLTNETKERVKEFLKSPESGKIWKAQALNEDGRIAAARVLGGESTFEQATKDLPEIQHGVVRALSRAQARGQERGPQFSL